MEGVITFRSEDVITRDKMTNADGADISIYASLRGPSCASILMLLNIVVLCARREENVAIGICKGCHVMRRP